MPLPDTLLPYFEALTFAAEQHKYQRRGGYDPLPYINHLIKVSTAIIQIGNEENPDIILASILHDIIEDSDTSHQDLKERFGVKVADIVMELTDDMALPYQERKALQIKGAQQLSAAARKIRIADKASNIQDIFTYPLDWKEEKKIAYLENSLNIVDQIRGTHAALEAWFDQSVQFARKVLSQTPNN
ncbi:MAG: HD domain-containing protein [Saprospiraceae bacterium]|nr:HD domain-containing protein [Saprospiraceae bacterium]